MATPEPTLQELERRLARLEALVARIADELNIRSEHPVDRTTVTQKTRYDWQD